MLREYLKGYMEGGLRAPDKDVLTQMSDRFIATTFRQFMQEREAKVGSYPPSAATKCARHNGLAYLGIESEPMDYETLFKFWYGDLVELGFIGLASLALKGTPHSIGLNNEFLEVNLGLRRKEKRKGFIDGLLSFDHDYHWHQHKVGLKPRWLEAGKQETLLLEVKSMGSWAFDMFQKEGPNDTWGYLGQISTYQRDLSIRRYLYVALDKEKGRIAEWIGDYDRRHTEKADAIHDEVMEWADKGDAPPVPPGYEPKPSGELSLKCSYCSRKAACWELQGYKLKTQYVKARTGPKPVFYVYKDGPGSSVKASAREKIRSLVDPESPAEDRSSYSR